jgi:pheromone shutdown protein TraB
VFAKIIPIAIFLLIAYGFISKYQTGLQQLKSWVLWNSVLAGFFTAAMSGHPFSILTAFISVPITSLNSFLACGWFAGLTDALIIKPTVDDINRVPDDIFHIKRFFRNCFLKAMVIVIFANIGSSLGTLTATYFGILNSGIIAKEISLHDIISSFSIFTVTTIVGILLFRKYEL